MTIYQKAIKLQQRLSLIDFFINYPDAVYLINVATHLKRHSRRRCCYYQCGEYCNLLGPVLCPKHFSICSTLQTQDAISLLQSLVVDQIDPDLILSNQPITSDGEVVRQKVNEGRRLFIEKSEWCLTC